MDDGLASDEFIYAVNEKGEVMIARPGESAFLTLNELRDRIAELKARNDQLLARAADLADESFERWIEAGCPEE